MFDKKSKLNYEIQNNHIVILENKDAQGEIVIPAEIEGLPVTVIGGGAFCGCKCVTSVTIPESITEIGDCALSWCPRLTTITIPNSVTKIGVLAFEGCTGFTDVTIPESVTTIGEYAFAGCLNLAAITIPKSVTDMGNWTFSGDRMVVFYTNNPLAIEYAMKYNLSFCPIEEDGKTEQSPSFFERLSNALGLTEREPKKP